MTEAVASRILRLSEPVISQVHSSKHISSLHGVVCALLENSLDAGSNKVQISVDWPRGGCITKDNGHGVSPVEFERDGGLAQMYCTSKRQPGGESKDSGLDAHGSCGMFLAELASLSLLSITSRTRDSDVSATITLHHGSVIGRQIGPLQGGDGPLCEPAEQHGTTVTVRDLFGSMPVRVKQRALAEPDEQRSWNELKRGVLALLLAWPDPCSVRLRDINSASRVVTLASHRPGSTSELTRKNLSHFLDERQTFDLRDVLPLIFQSGFASPESRSDWVPLSASTSSLSLKGLICLEPAPTKECQFISIGIHPCHRNSGHSELYEAIDGVFRNSDFGSTGSELVGHSRHGASGNAAKNAIVHRQASKGVDRFAKFYLQVNMVRHPGYRIDRVGDLDNALVAAIVNMLEVATSSWLDKNYFRPRKRRRMPGADLAGPSESKLHASPSASYSAVHTTYGPRQSQSNEWPTPTSAITFVESTTLPRDSWHNELTSDSHIRAGSAYGRSHIRLSNPPLLVTNMPEDGSNLQRSRVADGATIPIDSPMSHGLSDSSAIETGAPSEATRTLPERVRGNPLAKPPLPCLLQDCHNVPMHASDRPESIATSREDFGSIDENDTIAAGSVQEADLDSTAAKEQPLKWVDPISKRTFKVDARTGVVLPPQLTSSLTYDRSDGLDYRKRAALCTPLSSTSNHLRLAQRLPRQSQRSMFRDEHAERWLPKFLQSWNNPVFSVQSEKPIRAMSIGASSWALSTGQECSSHNVSDQECVIENIENLLTQLSKAALRNAEVIGQVDGKFVLCKMPRASTSPVIGGSSKERDLDTERVLVLVDQHAASERIIVERLLHEYSDSLRVSPTATQGSSGSVQESNLSDMRIQFNVTHQEYDIFKSYRDHFAAWGILYDTIQIDSRGASIQTSSTQESRIVVKSLPPVVAERCANVPKLCIDLMRNEAWALADGTRKPTSPSSLRLDEDSEGDPSRVEDHPVWLRLVSECPRGLLDMINSRACRSAIMFNDILTTSQCQSLTKELSACTFPFICAHGRVSMVPLVQIGSAQTV